MNHALDVELHDPELNTEIQLLAELMVIASEYIGSLDLATIDETLGLGPVDQIELPQQRVSA